MEFRLPPQIHNEKGEKRRVGFELEFGGLSLEEAARILLLLFNGEMRREGDYIYKVQTSLGEFVLEADSSFLKSKKYEKYLSLVGLNPNASALGHDIGDAFGKLAGTLIPFEIAMPPLPIDNLTPAERVRRELYQNSARGTKSAFFMAFGMQFNPELPDFRVETILKYLRSFFLLYDWLFEEADIPISRRVAPFIHDFPDEYIRQILNPSYIPNLDGFIADYLTHNPTRNRPLDLLPLLTYLDKEKVFSYPVEKDLIKPRPTFHYRLPNSMIDDSEWSLAEDWNKWIEVEVLAGDRERLHRMSEDYFNLREDRLLFVRSAWVEKTRQWLHV